MSSRLTWPPECLDAFIRIQMTVELYSWESFMTGIINRSEVMSPSIKDSQYMIEQNYKILRELNPKVKALSAEAGSSVQHLMFRDFEKWIIDFNADSISWWPDCFSSKEECMVWLEGELEKKTSQYSNN